MLDTLNEFRAFFPITKERCYLNHAATSPFSTRVVDALHEYIDVRSVGRVDPWRENFAAGETVRARIAELIHAPAHRIALVKNTSTGFNILATGLPWRAGDHLLLNDIEFPANVYPFLNLRRLGVDVEFVKSRDGRLTAEDYVAAMRPETRLVSVSFVQFLSGCRIDLAPLGEVCRERGIVLSVDPIQGLGGMVLDVEAMGIDFVSCGGHKWLMGPQGSGFIYVSGALQDRLAPAYVGWLSVKDSWDFLDYRLDLLDSAERFEIATENWMGVRGLGASVGLILEAGRERVEAKILALTDRLVEGLEERGCRVLSPRGPGEKSGIVLFSAGADNEAVFAALSERKIDIALREGNLRCAPHFYNSADEIDALLDAVGETTGRGSG
jgi:selenocysteine lyase/cysteine desulfurase